MTRHFLKGEAQARFTQDRIDIIAMLGKVAVENDARFMVVCGDLFDANQVAPQTVVRTVEKLGNFPVPVFILPGNHDPLNAATVYDHPDMLRLPDHIHILRDSEIHTVPNVPGVEVVAAPWHHKTALTDLCAQMLSPLKAVKDDTVRIAVAHGQLDSLSPDDNNPSLISRAVVQQALADRKIHYLALGDRHSVTDADDSGRVWYSGTPVATDFTEHDPNQVLLVDASVGIDPRPRVEPLTVGSWHFKAIAERVENQSDVDRLATQMASIENKERTVVRLALQGALKFNENVALEKAINNHSQLFASLRLHVRKSDLSILPDSINSVDLGLSGYARSCWDDLAKTASEDHENAEAASAALELFYRIASADNRAAR